MIAQEITRCNSSIAEPSRSRGILLIGHGTRDKVGTEQFFQLASRLTELVSPIPVEAALMEFQQPTIPSAWQSLFSRGVRHIHVAPLLLFAAGHARGDVPDIIDQCCAATPGVTFSQSLPLSRHPAIVDLVAERIENVSFRSAHQCDFADRKPTFSRTALVMVGRGNHDPCAQSDMRLLSEMVGHRLDFSETFTAFYAMAEPKLPEVLHRVAASDRFDSVIVHPHLLFEGRLHQAIIDQTNQISVAYPTMQFKMSAYLGPVAEVAKAVADRIDRTSTLWQCQS